MRSESREDYDNKEMIDEALTKKEPEKDILMSGLSNFILAVSGLHHTLQGAP